jgi:hypothetical protein
MFRDAGKTSFGSENMSVIAQSGWQSQNPIQT